MRCHSDGGEEIGSSPLHIDTLQGIGIVAYPELVEVRQHSVVGTTAATGTCLDGKVGIFGTDALADFLEAAVKFDVHVALIILRQILRTVVLDRHIGVPLDVIYFRIRGHQVVYHTENEVLHGRIGKVKHYLRAAASQHNVTFGSLKYPVGMLLVEFAGSVRHLRLNPDAKLDAMFLGITQQAFNAVRKLVLVHHPVAE